MDIMNITFIGKVKDQPQIQQEGDIKKAFLTLLVATDRIKGANDQWVDKVTEVPIFAVDKQADVIAQHVVAGQELKIDCVYENTPAEWGRWTLRAQFVKLGYKPKAAAGKGGGVGLPPA